MKSILIPFLLLVGYPTLAQNHFIGVHGGVSWTNANSAIFSFANPYYQYSRMGFTIGVSYENRLKQHLIVGADLMYQQRGAQDKYYISEELRDPFGSIFFTQLVQKDLKFYYDYLAVPLKCGYIIGNKISGFANIGLVPSFLLKASTNAPEEVDIIDITDLTPKFDLAVLFEIGGNCNLSERLLATVSFAFQQSFTTHSNYSHIKHDGMILTGGIKYALKKD